MDLNEAEKKSGNLNDRSKYVLYGVEDTPSLPMCFLFGLQVNYKDTFAVFALLNHLLQLTFPVAQTNSAQNIIIMTFNMTKAF
jgi:hypothetical protein